MPEAPQPADRRAGGDPSALPGRRRLELVTLLLAVVAAAAVLWPGLDPLRPVLVLPAFVLLPGAAVLVFLHVDSQLTWVVLALLLSLAAQTAVSLVLLWTGLWHPQIQSLVIGLLASAVLVVDLLRHRSPGPAPARARVNP